MMNFALDFLGTKVTCDKVSTDGYECINLISTNIMTRRKGYIAEHFVKPPVNITFKFPCNIKISHILLDPFVGRQQSLQIDVLCATKPTARTSHGKASQAKMLFSPDVDESYLPAFFQVSRATISDTSRICFYNSRRNQRLQQESFDFSEYLTKSEMRHSRAELLTSTSHVVLKIARTQNGSTPAVNNVEIWGRVSSSVCEEVKKLVQDKYISFATPAVNSTQNFTAQEIGIEGDLSDESTSCPTHSTNVMSCSSSKRKDDIEIPEEFLDPLTCEVMSIPMILPGGKNVDKSSLDRFSESELSHGRRPRDPFTGVEFSEVIKPIPNGDLKARIDAFLMSNSNIKSIASIPRTLEEGRSSRILGKRKWNDKGASISTLVNERQNSHLLQTNNFGVNNDGNKHTKTIHDDGKNKTVHTKTKPTLKRKRIHETVQHIACGSKDSPSISSSFHQSQGDDVSKSHEDRLKDSLNSALSSLLVFSTVKKAEEKSQMSTGINLCFKCCEVLNLENISYVAPCSHLICRKCLLAHVDHDINCLTCGSKFMKKDVVRSH